MMRFGFRPVVNCTAPPCYLSPSNAPGLQFQGGQPGLVNNAYSHYNPQMQQRPFFPALNDIRKSFNQRRRGCARIINNYAHNENRYARF